MVVMERGPAVELRIIVENLFYRLFCASGYDGWVQVKQTNRWIGSDFFVAIYVIFQFPLHPRAWNAYYGQQTPWQAPRCLPKTYRSKYFPQSFLMVMPCCDSML